MDADKRIFDSLEQHRGEYPNFSALISDYLQARNMTKYEFAKRVGVDQSIFNNWDRYETTRPQARTLKKIEQALGIRFLFDGEGNPCGWEHGVQSQDRPLSSPLLPDSEMEAYEYHLKSDKDPEWDELPKSEQKKIEEQYKILCLDIETAKDEFIVSLNRALRGFKRRVLTERNES